MHRKLVIGIVLAVMCCGLRVHAAPSEGQQQAAAELLKIMGLEKAMMAGATVMVDVQIEQNPTLGPFRDVLLKWAGKFMTWEAVSGPLIDLYAQTFSESEMKELVAFYKTPTGQKALAELPRLMQKGAAIGADLAKAHLPELEQMVRERAEELEKADKKPDSAGH